MNNRYVVYLCVFLIELWLCSLQATSGMFLDDLTCAIQATSGMFLDDLTCSLQATSGMFLDDLTCIV